MRHASTHCPSEAAEPPAAKRSSPGARAGSPRWWTQMALGRGRQAGPARCHCQKCQGAAQARESPQAGAGELLGASQGEPLPARLRSRFEPLLGVDLSKVRLHRDGGARDAARTLGAEAFTSGQDIAFGSGRFAPDTREGQELLAHELIHVAQQARGRSARRGLSNPGDAGEREAHALAHDLVLGRRLGTLRSEETGLVQRKKDGGSPEPTETQSCSGWESDPQSFTVRVAKHFFYDKLGRSTSIEVERVECRTSQSCEAVFANGERVQVDWYPDMKLAAASITQGGITFTCRYGYRCATSGQLELTDQDCYSLAANPYK